MNGLLRHSPSVHKGLGGVTPAVPTGLTLTVVSDTDISVAYTSNYPIEIWYSTDNVTYTKHGNSTATPYAMTGLTQGTLYYVKIRARNGSKYSAFTAVSSATALDISGTNLTGRYYQVAEGGDLIDYLGGVSIPYVSGSGIEQIFDFSVLSDERFNKSTWGTLDSYFYYNAEHLYYSKLKDFHYKKLNAQITFDDQIFLKAFATTDISNVIASVDELIIYSQTQTSTNLTKLKTYININNDFYSEELIINTLFDDTSNVVEYDANSTYTVDGTSGTLEKGTATTVIIAFVLTSPVPIGSVISLGMNILENPKNDTIKVGVVNDSWVGTTQDVSGTGVKTLSITTTGLVTRFLIRLYTYTTGSKIVFNSITTKILYQNYYEEFEPVPLNVTIYRATESDAFSSGLVAHNGIYRVIIDNTYKIRYSKDYGATYGLEYSLSSEVSSIYNINRNLTRITNDGNVLIFVPKERKILISTDECISFSDVTLLDINGDALTYHSPVNANYPGGYFNFLEGFDIGVINDLEVIVVGNYTNVSLGASPIYLYYSIDGGLTFKVFYEFGQNTNFTDDGTADGGTGGTLLGNAENPIITQHIHSVDFSNGKFIINTGDATNENWFMECNYNTVLDTWTTTFLNNTTGQRYRALGTYQDDSYYYWGSDGSGESGLFKCLISDINTLANHIKIIDPLDSCYGFKKVGKYVFAIMQNSRTVYISNDYGRNYYYTINIDDYITGISGSLIYIIKDVNQNIFSVYNDDGRIIIELND